MKWITTLIVAVTAVLLLALSHTASAESQSPGLKGEQKANFNQLQPVMETCTHTCNKMAFGVTNQGMFGSEGGSRTDCETGQYARSCEYPAGFGIEYLYAGALWIGAVVNDDSLVSTGLDGWQFCYELYSCAGGVECGIQRKSNNPSDPNYDPTAISNQDMVAVYTDTLSDPIYTGWDYFGREHTPLDIRVRQTSYCWSLPIAEDFIIIHYDIENIGESMLEDVFLGVYVDADVGHLFEVRDRYLDDLTGFRDLTPSQTASGQFDTINLAWAVDNDGDPMELSYGIFSARSATGLSILQTPEEDYTLSYNWWTSSAAPRFDWGPGLDNGRIFGTGGAGTPEGDENKYYLLSNGEIDYDQVFTAIDYTQEGWLPPPPMALWIATGADIKYLLSAGPFEIAPGQSVPFTVAYVAGERFHNDPLNYTPNLEEQYDPIAYTENIDLTDLSRNVITARSVFDNPGIDTDNDGDAGQFWIITDTVAGRVRVDTVYYRGDGVPDLRAEVCLPFPKIRCSTKHETVKLRWNGLDCENAVDPVSRHCDFEGYSAYMGHGPSLEELALLQTNDIANFREYVWNGEFGVFEVNGSPLTIARIEEAYGQGFDPLQFPLNENGEGFEYFGDVLCFEPVGWNQSIEGWLDGFESLPKSGIRKTYIDEILSGVVKPEIDSLNEDLWAIEVDYYTGDTCRYHKFYEYEYEIDNLMPTSPYYFSVVAFDNGKLGDATSMTAGSPTDNVVKTWPVNRADQVVEGKLDVSAYPNPYVDDGRYWRDGHENQPQAGMPNYEKRLNFINLPYRCKIKIYTLDGDLVKELVHPSQYSDGDSKLWWSLRSKDDKLVVSGIYIFCVESEWGNQIGKFVIVR